jgi:membrane associated rhomboid family serine protease
MARFAGQRPADPVPRLTDSDAKHYVTTGFLAINIIVFVAMVFSGDSPLDPSGQTLIRFGGTRGMHSLFFEQWRLLTSTFVHGGILHIAINMWCLWDLGGLTERIFDRWIYFLMYIFCGVAGMMAASWWNPRTITVGASGAIFGIVGALIAALYLGKLPIDRHAIQGTLRSVLIFAGLSLFWGVAVSSNVSNAAHIGGLVTGLALGAIMAPSLTWSNGKRQMFGLVVFFGATIIIGGILLYLKHLVS